LYDIQALSVNTSGYYNVFLGFTQNSASISQFPIGGAGFSILQGRVNVLDVATVDCANATLLAGIEGSYLSSQGFSLWLNANQNYTVVVTGGYINGVQTYAGRYVLTVSPGRRLIFASSISTYQPPDRSSCRPTSTCVSNTGFTPTTPLPYASASFQVPSNSYFYIDATENQDALGLSASRDLAFYLYRGSNPTASTCGGLTSSCFVALDTVSGLDYDSGTQSGTEWTIYVQAWFDSASFGTDASFDLYVISGPQLGVQTQTSAPSSQPSARPTSQPTAPTAAQPTPTAQVTPSAQPTRAPSVAVAPSVAGSSAPSIKTSAPSLKGGVNNGPLLNPGFASLFALVGFFWM
jgi:hypothetical protein